MPVTVVEKPLCGAKRAGADKEGTCRLPAGYGTGHPGVGPCKWHFGATKTIERKYALQGLRHTSIELMQQMGLDAGADITPEKVMREELRRSWILVHVIESQIDISDVLWPDMNKVLLDERKHAFECAAKMVSLGLAEREVRVLEAEAMVFAQGIRAILDRMDLSEEQRRRAPEIVRSVLAELPRAA